MTEALIFDHVRTPRGRGKADGSLHTASTLHLAATALRAIKDRNKLEPAQVDDVVMGCVDPVGEAGGDIARMALSRQASATPFRASRSTDFAPRASNSVNFAAAQVMSGQHDLTIGGGVESMSRVGIGASGGAWPADPSLAIPAYFMPQGVSADLIATKYGFSRDDVDAYAVRSQKRAAAAWNEGRFKKSIAPVRDVNGLSLLDHDEHMRPQTDMQSLASLKPSFVIPGEQGGFDAVAIQAHPEVERIIHVHHAGNSSGHRRRRRGRADRLARSGQPRGPEAASENPRLRQHRLGAGDHVDRSGRRHQEGARARWHEDRRHRPVRGQRGLRLGRLAFHAGLRRRSRTRSTSTAARSRWAIRSARPAR